MGYNKHGFNFAFSRREWRDIQKFDQTVRDLQSRIAEVEKIQASYVKPATIAGNTLLALPDHLRKTYVAVVKVGKCDASGISLQTGRARALESSYLNQLVREGWLLKQRASRKVVFSIMPKVEEKTVVN